MLPTLIGRIQTRIVILAVIGSIVTAIITPLLAEPGALAPSYRATFVILAAVVLAGIAWEFIYHAIQQFRWEKDWPTLFGLITALNEGALVWLALTHGLLPVGGPVHRHVFLIDFAAVWLCTWLWANGPMRALTIRWRFQGGRFI